MSFQLLTYDQVSGTVFRFNKQDESVNIISQQKCALCGEVKKHYH